MRKPDFGQLEVQRPEGMRSVCLNAAVSHPLPTAGGGELLDTRVRELSETRLMRHEAAQAGTYVEASCSLQLQWESCLQSFWLQMVQEKWEETRGRRWVYGEDSFSLSLRAVMQLHVGKQLKSASS